LKFRYATSGEEDTVAEAGNNEEVFEVQTRHKRKTPSQTETKHATGECHHGDLATSRKRLKPKYSAQK
jgi:hypothetical protein